MTETPQGRKRRADRHSRPEDIAPQTTTRTRQARAPIGRSQELILSPRCKADPKEEKREP